MGRRLRHYGHYILQASLLICLFARAAFAANHDINPEATGNREYWAFSILQMFDKVRAGPGSDLTSLSQPLQKLMDVKLRREDYADREKYQLALCKLDLLIDELNSEFLESYYLGTYVQNNIPEQVIGMLEKHIRRCSLEARHIFSIAKTGVENGRKVSEKERLAYADESLLFNTPYLDPGEVAELEVLRPSLAEDVLKSHRSRHGGKQSEVIDSQSLNGLLQDLEKKARERDHAGYWELWDKMPENPEIVVDVRELDGFFVAADALRKTYRIRLRRDMRRTLNGAPFDPDKIVYARWMGLVWNAATSPIEIKERLELVPAARKILNRPQGRGSADVVKAAAAIARYYERMALRAKYPGPRTHDAMNLKAFIPDPEYAARVEAFRMLKRGTRLFPTLADLSRIELTYNAMSALGCLSLLLVTLFAVATPFVLLKRYGVLVFIPAIIICLLAWVIVIVGFDSTPNEKIKEVQRNLYSFVSGNYD